MDTSSPDSLLRDGALQYGVHLDDFALSNFVRFSSLLSVWNSRMNLISKRDLDRLVPYHFLDSLKTASCFDFSSVHRLLDFGSGAGFPGIPLKLSFPHIETFLVDSRKKRYLFLEDVVRHLSLSSCHVLSLRIETLPAELNRSFDCVITRATVSLSNFFCLCRRFIRCGGSLIAIKGNSIDDELSILHSIVDAGLFSVRCVCPRPLDGVRTGKVVIITSL